MLSSGTKGDSPESKKDAMLLSATLPTTCVTPLVEEEDYAQSVLPREARENFDQIRSLLGEVNTNRCDDAQRKTGSIGDPKCTPCPSIQLKRRKLDSLATSTVMLLEDEMSRWLRGIAEMEQMLAAAKSACLTDSDEASNTPAQQSEMNDAADNSSSEIGRLGVAHGDVEDTGRQPFVSSADSCEGE